MKRASDSFSSTLLTVKDSEEIKFLMKSQQEIISELIKLSIRIKTIENKEKIREFGSTRKDL